MAHIKDYIARYIAGVKAVKKARHDAEIRARFRITERNGKIYLLCMGTAIAAVSANTIAKAITSYIEDARKAATEYDNGNAGISE